MSGESIRRSPAKRAAWRPSYISKSSYTTTPATARSSASHTTSGTCPGERDVVVLEWETAAFQSPSREGNVRPPDGVAAGNEFKPYIEDTYIELWELLTPNKMQEEAVSG